MWLKHVLAAKGCADPSFIPRKCPNIDLWNHLAKKKCIT